MNIAKYTSYFHDGSLLDIKQMGSTMEISLLSAEVDPEEITNIPLSGDDRIKGKLHLKEIKSIKIDDKILDGKLEMRSDDAEILHLKIHPGKINIQVYWTMDGTFDYSEIEIEAENIYWENLPNLNEAIL